MGGHRQVKVKVGRMWANIDEMLASMVKELWRAWVDTEESCQEPYPEDSPGMAWIYFPTTDDFKKFIRIVANNEDVHDMSSLYRRIFPPYGYDQPTPAWQYTLSVDDNAICQPGTITEVALGVAVLFPQSDIPEITAKLKRYNKDNQAIK